MSLASGQDVFAIAPTGAGKSAIMQGAVLADKARKVRSIAITVVPTKSLADDQAQAVNNLNIQGIKALALHEDTLEQANTQRPRRDLFREIRDGVYSHIFLGPEMIMSSGFDQVLKDEKFCEWFRYFGIDEVHVMVEWVEFRDEFSNLHRLRNRFKVPVAWIALTATVEPTKEFSALATSLGFDLAPGATNIIRLPVDRPTISYAPRFFKYGASDDQDEFPDLAFLIPRSLTNINDIPVTVVFGGLIKQVSKIAKYLQRLLPADLDPSIRREVIIPFNGTLSALHNGGAIDQFREGKKTRILTSTNSGALGINIKQVERVVILAEKDTNFRMICQKMGRIRTSGQAVIYFQRWMSLARTGSVDTARRSNVDPVIVDFVNSTLDRCPRAINIDYWGDRHAQHPEQAGSESAVPPSQCCNKHNPELDAADLEEVEGRATDMKAKKSTRNPPLRSDGTHPVPDSIVMRPIARDLIETWRREQLKNMVGYESHLPFSAALPNHLIDLLVEKLHVCSTFQRFQQIMKDWSRLDEFGSSLYNLVEKIWQVYKSKEGAKAIRQIVAPRKETEEINRADQIVEDEGLRENHVIAPAPNENTPTTPIQSLLANRKAKEKSPKVQGVQKKGKRGSRK